MSSHFAAKLYLPKVNRSSGAVIDMWIKVLSFSIYMYICVCVSVFISYV